MLRRPRQFRGHFNALPYLIELMDILFYVKVQRICQIDLKEEGFC